MRVYCGTASEPSPENVLKCGAGFDNSDLVASGSAEELVNLPIKEMVAAGPGPLQGRGTGRKVRAK